MKGRAAGAAAAATAAAGTAFPFLAPPPPRAGRKVGHCFFSLSFLLPMPAQEGQSAASAASLEDVVQPLLLPSGTELGRCFFLRTERGRCRFLRRRSAAAAASLCARARLLLRPSAPDRSCNCFPWRRSAAAAAFVWGRSVAAVASAKDTVSGMGARKMKLKT